MQPTTHEPDSPDLVETFDERVARLRELAKVRPDQVRIWIQRHPRNLMVYCGWEPQPFHDEGFEHFLANLRSLWLAPRGSGKSTVAVFIAAWLGIADPRHWAPGIRLFERAPRRIDPTNIRIALTSNSHPKAVALVWQVKSILTSREVALLFGPLAGSRWRDDLVDTRLRNSKLREPTFTALGLGSKVTGGHYDVVIGDDWVTLENARTKLQRERILDFWRFTVKGTCEPWCRVGFYGTRYHPKDFYGTVWDWASGKEEERGRVMAPWAVLRHPAIVTEAGADGEATRRSYWPTYFPLDLLDEIREEIGSIAFGTQYQNEVEGMLGEFFEAGWLEDFSPWSDRESEQRKLAMTGVGLDTAFKGGPKNDWTVFTVAHYLRPRDFHVERAYRGKWTKNEIVKKAEAIYRTHKFDRLTIEASPGVEWLIQDLKKSRVVPRGSIKAVPPRVNKLGRADKVRTFFENGWVSFDTPTPENGLQVVLDEMLAFTGETGQSDDCVDSLVWNLIGLSRGRSRMRKAGIHGRRR